MKFVERKRLRGRKQYYCYLCGKPIWEGVEHIRDTFTEGRKFHHFRSHLICEKFIDENRHMVINKSGKIVNRRKFFNKYYVQYKNNWHDWWDFIHKELVEMQ